MCAVQCLLFEYYLEMIWWMIDTFFSSPLGWGFPWNLRHVSVEKITQQLWRTKESRRLFSVPCSFTWTPVVSGYTRHTNHLVQLKSRLLVKLTLILVMPVICMNRLNNFSLIPLLTEGRKVWAKNQQTRRRVVFVIQVILGASLHIPGPLPIFPCLKLL